MSADSGFVRRVLYNPPMIKTTSPLSLLVFAVLSVPVAHACDGLVVDSAWVREPPPGADVAAGFMRFSNSGRAPLTIDAVTSPCCGHVMIHRTERHGNTMHMTHQDHLVLEPGQPVTFAPGGQHLMLMGLKNPLKAGDTVELEFGCAGHNMRTTLPVRADAP